MNRASWRGSPGSGNPLPPSGLPAGCRVVVTNPFAPPAVNRGSERLAMGLVGWLRSHGVDASLMAGGPRSAAYELEGVPIRTTRAPDMGRLWRELGPDLTFAPPMAARLARDRPDLVHSLLYQDAAAARGARVPYLVTYAGMPLPASFRGKPLNRWLFSWASTGARLVTCPSQAVRRHLRDTFAIDAEVIPYAVDASFFSGERAAVGGRIVCAAAPGDHRKRVDLLIEALPMVVEQVPDAHLRLAGPVDSRRRAELLAGVPTEVAERVSFLGEMGQEELKIEYLTASVSCLASIYEAFGLVVIEALAAGTPMVVADHGALPELVTAEVGRTFPAGDAGALARALVDVIRSNSDDTMAEACRRRAASFDWSVVGPQWLEAYRRVL